MFKNASVIGWQIVSLSQINLVNLYLYNISFLKIDMSQFVEIGKDMVNGPRTVGVLIDR